MCFDNLQQLNAFAYGLGLLTLPAVYAVYRFLRWAAISTVKSIIDGMHRKLFPERRQQPQQPRHDHNQPSKPQQQPQNNPNRHNNGQGQHNQNRPPQHFQQPHHQTQGQHLNA
jgi:hypothetical protein